MSKISTNWALYDPLKPKKTKRTNLLDTEMFSADIKRKLKLIEKAFR